MTLPIKHTLYKYSTKWPKFIVLHHTEELKLNDNSTFLDNGKFQTNKLAKTFYSLENEYLPYNYVVEKVDDEYNIITSSPLFTKINYLDLDDVYQESIHIGLMGNYNVMKVDTKMYNVLSLRLLVPMMRAFRIDIENVVKHSEVSLNPNTDCPGDFIDMPMLRMYVRTNMKVRALTRV